VSDPGNEGLRCISAEEFVKRLRQVAGQHDTHYAFWLGAGCSVSSGIPGAADLVRERWLPRLREVRGGGDTDIDIWAKQSFSKYNPDDPAAAYGPVMEELFIQPEARQREIEELCERRFPGFGYAVLADLLAREDGLFNVALTTNFDDLIADAMYVFTEARPLVIPDESLASFIRPSRLRPLVVKVHGDHRLSPRNTITETSRLKKDISESIGNLLHDRGVIFVGYGGNDAGIADLFNSLPAQALPLGIWWASRTEPRGVLREWLEKRAAIWVEIPGFDELMLLFKSEFEIPNPNSNKFDQVFKNYLSTYSELERQVGQIPDSHPQASSLKGAAARAEASSTDWTAIYLRALFVGDQDLERAEELFKEGIKDFPRAPLLYVGLSYLLLGQARFEEALEWSQKAFELDPDTLNTAYAYAETLAVAGHTDEALDRLRALVEKFPREILPRFGYGIFSARSGDLEAGREQFKVIAEMSPSTAHEYALAGILADDCRYFEKGKTFHERAISEDPGDGSLRAHFARNLIARDEPDEALEEIGRANKLLPATDRTGRLQTFFYEAAIADGQDRDAALVELRALIDTGTRLSTWTFQPVIEFCERKGDSEAPWMAKLAEVVAGRQDVSVLESWPRWKEL